MDRTHRGTVGAIRGNETDKRDDARIGKQPRNLADAPNVLVPIGGTEPKARVQAMPNVVTIKPIRHPAAAKKLGLKRYSDGGLAGSRKPGKPERAAATVERGPSLFAGECGAAPHDVGSWFGHGGRV